MTTLLDYTANRIPCGRCCRQLVRVRPTDDRSLVTERCPDGALTDEDIAANGDRVLLRHDDGYCIHLSDDKTHCLLVTEQDDRRPFACRDGWPNGLCLDMGCPKFTEKP